jgi:soluble P-type ATPase
MNPVREYMLEIDIPSRGVLRLGHLILDVNGTIALDGRFVSGVRERLERLSGALDVWLADECGHAGHADGISDRASGQSAALAIR